MPDTHYLYIEDDRLSREVIKLVMQDIMGISTLTIFENSENFLERLRNLPERPNVVLLDIHVHPITGFEMLRVIRSQPGFEATKVIAVTASVMNEEVQKLRSAGFDGTISKPIDTMVFPTLLQRITQGEAVWQIF
jgi:CheY-like chemotaxis protein